MNSRIKQLAEQVGFNMHNDIIDGHNFNYEIGKFADLIVKECLSFCEYEGDRFDEYDSGMTERARIIRESIQEHFELKNVL